jgi:hypothetical protein
MSWLSCKKKYKSIIADYRKDKMANEVSGADRHQECKWFTEMDEWHGNTASVHNQISASATESNFEDIIPSTFPSQTTTTTTPNSTTTSTQNNKTNKQGIFLRNIYFLNKNKNLENLECLKWFE